jgi:hypothetical protein
VALFPAVPAKDGTCENPASATLQVFGIVGYGDQLAELAAGLAGGEERGGSRAQATRFCFWGLTS